MVKLSTYNSLPEVSKISLHAPDILHKWLFAPVLGSEKMSGSGSRIDFPQMSRSGENFEKKWEQERREI